MKTGTFILEVVLEEDENSYHGELVDFEKDLARALDDVDRVIAFKITDTEENKSYNGVHLGKSAESAIQRAITTHTLRERELSRKNGDF